MLGFMNQLRGMHSTGVARVWKNYKTPFNKGGDEYRFDIKKDTKCAQDFFSEPGNQAILNEVTPVAILGHCRHATVGANDDPRGAHPFENQKYIGFHNGTLREDRFTKHPDFLTDSEALWDELANSDNPTKILEELDKDSAFALAFFDKNRGRIGFVRNDKRPLSFAVHQKRNVVYYSSEVSMLHFVLGRFGVDYETYGLGPWKLLETKPDQLTYTFKNEDDPKNKYRVNTWWIKDLVANPPKEEPKVVTQSFYDDLWKNDDWRSNKDHKELRAVPCKSCADDLQWATKANGRLARDNPIHLQGYGLVCSTCYDFWTKSGDDDEDADQSLGDALLEQPSNVVNLH